MKWLLNCDISLESTFSNWFHNWFHLIATRYSEELRDCRMRINSSTLDNKPEMFEKSKEPQFSRDPNLLKFQFLIHLLIAGIESLTKDVFLHLLCSLGKFLLYQTMLRRSILRLHWSSRSTRLSRHRELSLRNSGCYTRRMVSHLRRPSSNDHWIPYPSEETHAVPWSVTSRRQDLSIPFHSLYSNQVPSSSDGWLQRNHSWTIRTVFGTSRLLFSREILSSCKFANFTRCSEIQQCSIATHVSKMCQAKTEKQMGIFQIIHVWYDFFEYQEHAFQQPWKSTKLETVRLKSYT